MTALDIAVPELARPRRARAPRVADRTLETGLRVLAVRRPGVPVVELRLRIPFAGRAESHIARSSVLTDTMLTGTASLSNVDIAVALQEIGGSLDVSADPDRLLLSGNALASGLPRMLDLLADLLTTASYPKAEVDGERNRLVERLRMAWSQPRVLARDALVRRMYGAHPYAWEVPQPDAVADVTPAQVRTLHRNRVLPTGSTLVLVGDVSPERAVDGVERALGGWVAARSTRGQTAPALPELPGPVVRLVDRPGAVQSNIRLGGRAVPREDPDYPAMQLANMVFGGYFSSRLTENLREDKGYTYSPHCIIDHSVAGSALLLEAEVATEVTAPALLEIDYELGRMATLSIGQDELDNARQYAIGTLALSTASQSGLATMLAALLASGLGPDWLREHPQRLAAVTADEVVEQARRYLAPVGLVRVIVGDAGSVAAPLARLGEVEHG